MQKVLIIGIAALGAILFIGLAVNYATHHRGQLSIYLRTMGGKTPRIDGESDDVPMKIQIQQILRASST